jgi:hypothetical protein
MTPHLRIAMVRAGPTDIRAARHSLNQRENAVLREVFEHLPTLWAPICTGIALTHDDD